MEELISNNLAVQILFMDRLWIHSRKIWSFKLKKHKRIVTKQEHYFPNNSLTTTHLSRPTQNNINHKQQKKGKAPEPIQFTNCLFNPFFNHSYLNGQLLALQLEISQGKTAWLTQLKFQG